MTIGYNILNSNWTMLLGTVVLWLLSKYVFQFDGLYGQDAYEYFRYTKALQLFLSSGINPGDYFWPLYYPIVGALLGFILKPAVSLQLISIASFLITGKYLVKIINLVYPKHTTSSLFIALFFLLSPMVFRLSLLVMSDMLTALFIVLCYYNGLLYLKKETISNVLLFTLFGVSAIMTRYAAFVILFPLGCYALITILKAKRNLNYLPLLILITVALILPHLIVRHQNVTAFLGHPWLNDWSVLNFFKSTFNSNDGISHYFLPNIIYSFSAVFDPRYFFAGMFLIIPFFKTKNQMEFRWVFVVSFILYGLFLAGIPYQNNRYLFLCFPILLIVLFHYFNWIWEFLKKKKLKKFIIIAIAVIQIVLCFLSLKPILERNSFELKMASQMNPYQNNTLYSFDIDVALQGRGLKFNYQNLWIKKYASFEENALVLFHPKKFEHQWKGRNPMLNWSLLENHYHLKIIRHFPEGWTLYKISKK